MAGRADNITNRRRLDAHKRIAKWGTPENNYMDSGLWEFLRYVKTKDEHDDDHPVKPIPHLERPYMQCVFLAMLHEPVYAIPKSRQIMVSWMLAAFAAWFVRTAPYRNVIWQSKKEGAALDMVSHGSKSPGAGRIDFIEQHLPDWLRDPHIYGGEGNRVGHMNYYPRQRTKHKLAPVIWYGSKIKGVPMGADQVRSETVSLFISDEAAFQEEFGDTVTALRPAVAGGGRFLAVSSASPGHFVDMVLEGQEMDKGHDGYRVPLLPGMKSWRTPSGVYVMEVHYTADEHKDPARGGAEWMEEAARGYIGGIHSPGWRREMEIDYYATGGDPVFPFLIDPRCPIYTPRFSEDTVINTMRLYSGFDYGYRNESAYVVWGFDRKGIPHAVWEIYEPCTNYKAMAAKIKAGPYWDHIMVNKCDPAIVNQKDQNTSVGMKSIAELFAQEGVHFSPGRRGQDHTIALRFLGHYWADPKNPTAFLTQACPAGRRELANLRWAEHKSQATQQTKNNPEKIMDKDNHWWDATSVLFDGRPAPLGRYTSKPRRGSLDWSMKILDKQLKDERSRKGYVSV